MTVFMGFPQDGHAFSADEVGRALAGLVQREANGTPTVGMLAVGPAVSAVAASWKVEVGVFTYVHQVAGAVQFSGLSAAEQVDIVPAAGDVPSGQARIDLIVWDPAEPELVVVKGTPSASPSVPSDGGLVPVAEVRVNAGDGMTIQGQITPVFGITSLVGGSRAQKGVVEARTIPRGSSVTVPIVFDTPFSGVPNVQVTLTGVARDCNATAHDIKSTGFTLYLGSNSVVNRTGGATWRAEPA